MFEFNTWVVDNLISGVKNNKFSKEWASIQLANYFVKGRITEADIERFEEATVIPKYDDTIIEDFENDETIE